MGVFIYFLLLLQFFTSLVAAGDGDLLVTLPNGQIRGHQLQTPANKTFYGFQGIPYAAPPLGKLRFQAPVGAENWSGIWNATKEGNDCINKDSVQPSINSESEDCLFINVYTPKLNQNSSNVELLPVMFWIYGGAYVSGSSSSAYYGPDYLVEEDIVFVSFNYRLGAFGFLSTGDEVIPGNAGLKDQNFALKWTYDNIHLFGGDKEKTTIFGESAGACSVTYHILSQKSAGLFRAAIAESGSALGSWALNSNPIKYAYDLVSKISEDNNIPIDNNTFTSKGVLEFLSNQTTAAIKNADDKFAELFTVPVLEYEHENSFISEANYQLFDSGKINQVPLIIGMNSEEYLLFIKSMDSLAALGKSFDDDSAILILPDLILKDSANITKLSEKIKNIYIDSNQFFQENLGALVRYETDSNFATSIIKTAELHAKFSDVYVYQFAYNGPLGRIHQYSVDGTLGDVAHGEELFYLFKNGAQDISIFPEQDLLTRRRMIKLWTNFAKFLNPTQESSELFQNVTWPVISQNGFQYLNISDNLEVVEGYPRAGSYEEWNKIYNAWGVQPFITF